MPIREVVLAEHKGPNLPIVKKGGKFTVRYKDATTSQIQLVYLKEHWLYFNKTRFGGRLKPARIGLLKGAATLKLSGQTWIYGKDTPVKILIAPKTFGAPNEGWLNHVLIHEMCHQEVGEKFEKVIRLRDSGHGPKWKQCMRNAGLIPSVEVPTYRKPLSIQEQLDNFQKSLSR